MKTNIVEMSGGHLDIPERKTDPIGVNVVESFDPEQADIFKALAPGGDAHNAFSAFMDTVKADLELFSAVRDETYNHDQLMESRALVKYLTALAGRVDRIVTAAKKEEKTDDEADQHKPGSRVY